MHERGIEKSEIILKRSTSAQIMQPNEFIDKIFQEEGNQDDTADCDGGSVSAFVFENNQQLFNHVN